MLDDSGIGKLDNIGKFDDDTGIWDDIGPMPSEPNDEANPFEAVVHQDIGTGIVVVDKMLDGDEVVDEGDQATPKEMNAFQNLGNFAGVAS